MAGPQIVLIKRAGHFLRGLKIGADTETNGTEVWQGDQPFFFSFCNEEQETAWFRFPVNPRTRRVSYAKGYWSAPGQSRQDDAGAFDRLKDFFGDGKIQKDFWNAKFDIRMCEKQGLHVAPPFGEGMFKAHACNTDEMNYKLKMLAKKYVGISDDDQKALQKSVCRIRHWARKLGWKIHEEVEADYWLPYAVLDNRQDFTPQQYEEAEQHAKNVETYAVTDAIRTIALSVFYDDVMEQEGVTGVYENEMELWPITYAMEERGVLVDSKVLEEEIQACKDRIEKYRSILTKYVGKRLNGDTLEKFLNSPKRLAGYLYDPKPSGLGLIVETWTKGGKKGVPQPATNVDALEKHLDNEFVEHLFRFRTSEKAMNTFFLRFQYKGVPAPEMGGLVIHTDFNQVGPITGRYSGRDPNLQNVTASYKARGKYVVEARRSFRPRPGYTWYHIDYSQLEVRIFADIAQEETMLAAIANDRDMHTECGNKAWGGEGNPAAIRAALSAIEWSEAKASNPELGKLWDSWGWTSGRVSRSEGEQAAAEFLKPHEWQIVEAEKSIGKKNTRGRAKLLLFTKIFGGGKPSVSRLLKITTQEAGMLLRDYDIAFPDIVRAIKTISAEGRANGFVMTNYGRKIRVDSDHAYRGVNYRVQGSAANLLKRAMIRCRDFLRKVGLDIHIVMTIHDELVFEVRNEHAYIWVLRALCEIMADNEGHFGVETPVEMSKVTHTWNEKLPVVLDYLNTKATATAIKKEPKAEKLVKTEGGLWLVLGENPNTGEWCRKA